MDSILVIKLADIGDVLTATPGLRLLREQQPQATITGLFTPHTAAIPRSLGLVDDAIEMPKHRFDQLAGLADPRGLAWLAGFARGLAARRFDAVLLLHHLTTRLGVAKYAALVRATGAPRVVGLDNGQGWFLTERTTDLGFGHQSEVQYNADVVRLYLGRRFPVGPMEFPVTDDDRVAATTLLASLDRAPVVVHPGSGSFSTARRWAPERFREAAEEVTRVTGRPVVVVGGADEGELASAAAPAGALNLAGQTSLGVLAAILERAALLLSNDSGLKDIAAAVGTPTVTVFGPSNADAWAPWRPAGEEWKTVVIRHQMACMPCFYTGTSLGHPNGCPPRTCLRLVTPGEVAHAALALLDRAGSH